MTCEDCKFWSVLRDARDAGVGECRRRAPSPATASLTKVLFDLTRATAERRFADATVDPLDGVRANEWPHRFRDWPTTAAEDWCGEGMPHERRQGFV